MSLPENVYRLRITDGHTIDHVAEASGVPSAIVSAIENGRSRVPPKVIRALAQHFRVSEAELLK